LLNENQLFPKSDEVNIPELKVPANIVVSALVIDRIFIGDNPTGSHCKPSS